MQTVQEIISEAQKRINQAANLRELEDLKVYYFGKKGQLTEYLKQLGTLPHQQRKEQGQLINQAKQEVLLCIEQRSGFLLNQELEQELNNTSLDVSLPGYQWGVGSEHPITQTLARFKQLFISMGFEVTEGPEIEDAYHNFEALNIPEHHPARASHDTFYLEGGNLLRTHTSPGQIRVMEKQAPPLRIVTLGPVYRCDWDHTHTPMFHQLECLLIDENITFADLKGLLEHVLQTFFERELKFRFRASYFPFTEPSAEVDIQCVNCEGKGCRTCGQTGWLEVLGCGMVHPKVFSRLGINNERFTGLAFGLGIDRLAMLRYGVNDLRLFFENDLRFLKYF